MSRIVMSLAVAACLVGNRTFATQSCPGTISVSQTLSDDVEETTMGGTCVTIGTSSLNFNLGGHKIICNNAGGCQTGININNSATSVTVHNGFIVDGTGQWSIGVVNNGALANTVSNITFANMPDGIVDPYDVDSCIMVGITDRCMTDFFASADDRHIQQNYCSSSDTGILLIGATSSAHGPLVEKNYITATTTSIDVSNSNKYATLQHNIIGDGAIVTASTAGHTTLTENICSDSTTCPKPDDTSSNFSLSLDFQ